jgi:dTDP-4-dehydrorhamnose 3,5-epimerase-like enzyme
LKPELIKGGSFTDGRGSLLFVNDFDFKAVKRFYQIVHPEAAVVRAWQGHKVEHKYFYAVQGSFVIATVCLDHFANPSLTLQAEETILTTEVPAILSVPPGFANGIKALSSNAILMVYSNLTLAESEQDRYSYDSSLWVNWHKYQE